MIYFVDCRGDKINLDSERSIFVEDENGNELGVCFDDPCRWEDWQLPDGKQDVLFQRAVASAYVACALAIRIHLEKETHA